MKSITQKLKKYEIARFPCGEFEFDRISVIKSKPVRQFGQKDPIDFTWHGTVYLKEDLNLDKEYEKVDLVGKDFLEDRIIVEYSRDSFRVAPEPDEIVNAS